MNRLAVGYTAQVYHNNLGISKKTLHSRKATNSITGTQGWTRNYDVLHVLEPRLLLQQGSRRIWYLQLQEVVAEWDFPTPFHRDYTSTVYRSTLYW
jgi:hypothetical protein